MTGTVTFINHYATGGSLEVLIGTINGIPIYGPYGSRSFTVTVSEQWLKDNPPKPPAPTCDDFVGGRTNDERA
jgi:hypothetical protein